MRLIKDVTSVRVEFDPLEPSATPHQVYRALHDALGVKQDGVEYSTAYRQGRWDGITNFYDSKSQTFPIGLFDKARVALEPLVNQLGVSLEIIDDAPDYFVKDSDIPDEITLNTKDGGEMTLRDYQYDAVKAVIHNHTGIVNLATNAGKTASAAGVIKVVLPKLKSDERVAFFTNSKEIFTQVKDVLAGQLGIDVGYYGGGKKKFRQVNVCMIQSVYSALKIDPTAKVKFTEKERILKRLATEIAPKFIYGKNQRQALLAYRKFMKVTTKPDKTISDTLEDLVDESGTDGEIAMAMRGYVKEFEDLLKKKNASKFKKKKEIQDFLDSISLLIADECLTANTLVTMEDGSLKPIKDVVVGDQVKDGGKVLHTKVTDAQPVVRIRTKSGMLEGSFTHPVPVIRNDEHLDVPMGQVREDDVVMLDSSVQDYIKISHGTRETFFSNAEKGYYGTYMLAPVQEVSLLDREDVLYDLTTETGNFIANGMLTRNCHHSKSDSWYRIFENAKNSQYRMALSGSIDWDDEMQSQRLTAIFGPVIARVTNEQLIERGISAKPYIQMAEIREPSRIKTIDYMDAYKRGIVENEYRNNLICLMVQKAYQAGKTALVIVNWVNHGKLISDQLKQMGIPHVLMNGQQDSETRKQELDSVKLRDTKVVIATSILDEGVDISGLDMLVMAAGGKSMRQVLQRIGRVLRAKKGTENKCVIADFIDKQNKHLYKHSQERLAIYKREKFDITMLGGATE